MEGNRPISSYFSVVSHFRALNKIFKMKCTDLAGMCVLVTVLPVIGKYTMICTGFFWLKGKGNFVGVFEESQVILKKGMQRQIKWLPWNEIYWNKDGVELLRVWLLILRREEGRRSCGSDGETVLRRHTDFFIIFKRSCPQWPNYVTCKPTLYLCKTATRHQGFVLRFPRKICSLCCAWIAEFTFIGEIATLQFGGLFFQDIYYNQVF